MVRFTVYRPLETGKSKFAPTATELSEVTVPLEFNTPLCSMIGFGLFGSLLPNVGDSSLRSYLKMQRTILVGDIHGCFREFMELLKRVEYNTIDRKDRLILLGDLIGKVFKLFYIAFSNLR